MNDVDAIPSAANHIVIDDSAGVRRILFNRPEKRNAFTAEMYQSLAEAMQAAEDAAEVRVILFEGASGCFTAGNDLGDFEVNPPRDKATAPVFAFLRSLVTCTKPLLAAVDGPAIGIGSTLLLHCDVVYASERAKFAFPFIDLALVPEAASSILLAGRVGTARAREWLLFGEPVSAADAERSGLVTNVVPHAELSAFAHARAEILARKPAVSMRLSRELVHGPHRAATLEALDRESDLFTQQLQSAEAKAQFAAFRARKASGGSVKT